MEKYNRVPQIYNLLPYHPNIYGKNSNYRKCVGTDVFFFTEMGRVIFTEMAKKAKRKCQKGDYSDILCIFAETK
ncbi:MAG: hypothetical protein IKT00_12975 [Prevotella sp.]|nr:hypothetical protein [Prevotella sp.]